MAGRSSTTLRRKELGRRLRQLRADHGMTIEDVAEDLLCSATKVSRMESGSRPVSARDVRDLCRLFAVGEAERDQLMNLVRESRQTSWWQAYDLEYGTYIGLEQSAVRINEYNPIIIPGLLQTRAYAAALIGSLEPKMNPETVQSRVAARIERQSILSQSDDAPQLWAIVDQLALTRIVENEDVMREQLTHLVDVSRLKNVYLQVIPISAQPYPGYSSSFILLEFGQAEVSPVLYIEGNFGDAYLERPADIKRGRDIFDQLRATGHGPVDSRALILEMHDHLAPRHNNQAEEKS